MSNQSLVSVFDSFRCQILSQKILIYYLWFNKNLSILLKPLYHFFCCILIPCCENPAPSCLCTWVSPSPEPGEPDDAWHAQMIFFFLIESRDGGQQGFHRKQTGSPSFTFTTDQLTFMFQLMRYRWGYIYPILWRVFFLSHVCNSGSLVFFVLLWRQQKETENGGMMCNPWTPNLGRDQLNSNDQRMHHAGM